MGGKVSRKMDETGFQVYMKFALVSAPNVIYRRTIGETQRNLTAANIFYQFIHRISIKIKIRESTKTRVLEQ